MIDADGWIWSNFASDWFIHRANWSDEWLGSEGLWTTDAWNPDPYFYLKNYDTEKYDVPCEVRFDEYWYLYYSESWAWSDWWKDYWIPQDDWDDSWPVDDDIWQKDDDGWFLLWENYDWSRYLPSEDAFKPTIDCHIWWWDMYNADGWIAEGNDFYIYQKNWNSRWTGADFSSWSSWNDDYYIYWSTYDKA